MTSTSLSLSLSGCFLTIFIIINLCDFPTSPRTEPCKPNQTQQELQTLSEGKSQTWTSSRSESGSTSLPRDYPKGSSEIGHPCMALRMTKTEISPTRKQSPGRRMPRPRLALREPSTLPRIVATATVTRLGERASGRKREP